MPVAVGNDDYYLLYAAKAKLLAGNIGWKYPLNGSIMII
jgi:hypothetical protein